jgi:hypothetical protein
VTLFIFISCRRRDDQGKRKNTADRICMRQRRQHARSLQHRPLLSEAEAVYDSTVANEPSPWPLPSPPSVLSSSPTPLTLTIPAVARPVSRRLTITMEQPPKLLFRRLRQTQHHPPCTVHRTGCSSIRSRERAVASNRIHFTVSDPS